MNSRKWHKTLTEIIYTVVGEYSLNLSTWIPEHWLLCLHTEADTALFTIYNSITAAGYINSEILDTDDTDSYIQDAYVSNKVSGSMLIKQKKEYINAQSLCRQEDIDTIIPLHIMTGSGQTSAFYGVGKKVVADRVNKSAEARNLISCAASLDLTDKVIADMSTFMIKYVYNDKSSITPAAARAVKWRCHKIKSITRMIPNSERLFHLFKRVNYMVYIQKNFHLKEHPSPSSWLEYRKCVVFAN